MTAPDSVVETNFAAWLKTQPIWLQHGAQILLEQHAMGPQEILSYARMALAEANGNLLPPTKSPELNSLGMDTAGAVSLLSISKVSGIGHLHPQKPLSFGSERLVIVYGSTGSGKSSYVRILKHACGARDKGSIYADAFDSTSSVQGCNLEFSDGTIPHSVDWTVESGVIPALATVDIFDTQCGHSYISCEGQPSYEPRLLTFLSQLATLCDQVAERLMEAIAAKTKALPAMPAEHANTNVGRWYERLTSATKQTEIEETCHWRESDEEELARIAKYLGERSPQDRAKELEVRKTFIASLVSSLKEHRAAFRDEQCRELMNLRRTAQEKQQAAELAAKVNVRDAILEGIGTRQWLSLWAIAKTYSTELAYPNEVFPYTGDNARCVLCQEELSPAAKTRLLSFEEYVVDKATVAAKTAKESLEKAIERLPSLPDAEILEAKAVSGGLDQASLTSLRRFYGELNIRRDLLLSGVISDDFSTCSEIEKWGVAAQAIADAYTVEAKRFRDGFNQEERLAKSRKQKELEAQKWVSAQKIAVEQEVERLKKIAMLGKAKELCGTRQISLKKGALAVTLITPAYIEAFNSELERLGARRIRVTMVQTRVERGSLLHQVKLRDPVRDQPIEQILSEGEHRIVCIAAFLADVSAKPNGSTFVFDDPISSLDLDFEGAVVRRLVDLSRTRQVVVFTHRLSLLGMIEEYAEKAKIPNRIIHIRAEPWGAGEPGDAATEAAKPKAVLNDLLPKRIATAALVLEKEGEASYLIHAQSICTETRKIVERMIEFDLLADVIQRHRRVIKTLNKIGTLADIQPEDCRFLDEMMSKYSRYEHGQSREAPVNLPRPDELSEDVFRLKAWRDGLDARRKAK
jgi:energy-coupling factor transporter ATP-binding protein EcfA2